MITIKDCIDVTGCSTEELELMAEHEHLPFIVAVEKAQNFVDQPWGDAALRQIVGDFCDTNHKPVDGRSVDEIYQETCAAHQNTFDRRSHKDR